jgi:hypothetical protein
MFIEYELIIITNKLTRYIGIDIWQVESGTIFDNIFLGFDLFLFVLI